MQSKFMLFVFLTLLFATYSECLKCHTYLKTKGIKGGVQVKSGKQQATCSKGEVCVFTSYENVADDTSVKIASCASKAKCTYPEEGIKVEMDGEAFSNLVMAQTGAESEIPDDAEIEVFARCCSKNLCNVSSNGSDGNLSYTKMARYFLGLALSITFLNVIFYK